MTDVTIQAVVLTTRLQQVLMCYVNVIANRYHSNYFYEYTLNFVQKQHVKGHWSTRSQKVIVSQILYMFYILYVAIKLRYF